MGTRTILVVEDDDDIREVLREVLQDEGYAVRTAANGRAGLDSLGSEERPGLILLDLMMPVMSGWDFLAALRENPSLRSIPVLVVSAWGEQASRSGASGVLDKPLDLDRLMTEIAQCFDRSEHAGDAHPAAP
jgi:CheY-like chemotaxis protein